MIAARSRNKSKENRPSPSGTQGLESTLYNTACIVDKVLAGESLTSSLEQLRDQLPDDAFRPAIQDAAYGTLRYYGLLEALVKNLSDKPVRDPRLTSLLLAALYLLNYGSPPAHAVVDCAVNAARHLGRSSAKGLVNAVLRNFLRSAEERMARISRNEVACYSFPQWWIDRLRAQYPNDWQDILKISLRHPPMTLRINKRQTDVGAYLRQLKQAGIVATALDDTAVVLEKPVSVSRLPGFSSGLSSVQDWGAQHAARLLDAHDSARVLDACSAPGGKTAHVLECADIQLTAVDIDSARQQKTPQNLERLRLSARCVTGDILQPEEWWDGIPFHRVLLDAPCSASGVTRRHPDIKWLRRESDIQHYADTQGKMLDALWRLLSKGGKLLYTTCSVFAEENQSQILAFLGRHHDAQQLPLGLSTLCNGQLLPGEYHDGFFYALLLKR